MPLAGFEPAIPTVKEPEELSPKPHSHRDRFEYLMGNVFSLRDALVLETTQLLTSFLLPVFLWDKVAGT
jgi:hypothetical protein